MILAAGRRDDCGVEFGSVAQNDWNSLLEGGDIGNPQSFQNRGWLRVGRDGVGGEQRDCCQRGGQWSMLLMIILLLLHVTGFSDAQAFGKGIGTIRAGRRSPSTDTSSTAPSARPTLSRNAIAIA